MSAKAKAKISAAERKARQESVDFARHSVGLEGFQLSPEVEALNQRYIDGEISHDEHTDAIHQLYGV